MRALLVNPWITDFKCHDFWIKPFGLLKIATLLKSGGFEIDFIDCLNRFDKDMPEEYKKIKEYGKGDFYFEEIEKPECYKKISRKYKRYGLPKEVFLKKLEQIKKPDIILVTSNMSYTYEGTFEMIKILKEKFLLTPLILGGIYATICYNHSKEKSGADLIWQGNVNNNFIRLINNATGSKIEYLSEENNFNEILPDYSLYFDENGKYNIPYVVTKFTNGCPFSCTYCAIKLFSDGYYKRDKKSILKELDIYKSFGVKNIAFYDDALLYRTVFIKDLLKDIIKNKYEFNFHTPNGLHAAYIDEEIAGLLKNAGFVDLRVSLESSDFEIQKATGGKITNDIFKNAINNLKKAGFKNSDIGVYILAGLPGQTFESILKDIEFVKQFKVKIKLANYSPIPGTADYLRLKNNIMAELKAEPLKQNEFYFLTINTDYDWQMNEEVKKIINEYNNSID